MSTSSLASPIPILIYDVGNGLNQKKIIKLEFAFFGLNGRKKGRQIHIMELFAVYAYLLRQQPLYLSRQWEPFDNVTDYPFVQILKPFRYFFGGIERLEMGDTFGSLGKADF